MPISAERFKGKLKREIANEAFKKFGPEATIQQVDKHFQKYGLPHCERSMYHGRLGYILAWDYPGSDLCLQKE